jgi:hypothetical protein
MFPFSSVRSLFIHAVVAGLPWIFSAVLVRVSFASFSRAVSRAELCVDHGGLLWLMLCRCAVKKMRLGIAKTRFVYNRGTDCAHDPIPNTLVSGFPEKFGPLGHHSTRSTRLSKQNGRNSEEK